MGQLLCAEFSVSTESADDPFVHAASCKTLIPLSRTSISIMRQRFMRLEQGNASRFAGGAVVDASRVIYFENALRSCSGKRSIAQGRRGIVLSL